MDLSSQTSLTFLELLGTDKEHGQLNFDVRCLYSYLFKIGVSVLKKLCIRLDFWTNLQRDPHWSSGQTVANTSCKIGST